MGVCASMSRSRQTPSLRIPYTVPRNHPARFQTYMATGMPDPPASPRSPNGLSHTITDRSNSAFQCSPYSMFRFRGTPTPNPNPAPKRSYPSFSTNLRGTYAVCPLVWAGVVRKPPKGAYADQEPHKTPVKTPLFETPPNPSSASKPTTPRTLTRQLTTPETRGRGGSNDQLTAV